MKSSVTTRVGVLLAVCAAAGAGALAAKPRPAPPYRVTAALVSQSIPNCRDTTRFAGAPDMARCPGFARTHFPPAALGAAGFAPGAPLPRETGLLWAPVAPGEPFLDFSGVYGHREDRVVYAADLVHAAGAQDAVLAVGSDDGFSAWLNGVPLATVTTPRNTRARDDLVRVRLRPGDNVFLYKVKQGSGEWSLYRELLSVPQAAEWLRTRGHRAYVDLPDTFIADDTATYLPMKRQLNLRTGMGGHVPGVEVRLADARDALRATAAGGTEPGPPARLRLPDGFSGAGTLQLRVFAPGTDQVVYRETAPFYTRAEADRRAAAWAARPAGSDPVLQARRAAVLQMFHLDGDTARRGFSTRMQAHALADLERAAADPAGFHRHPGPQVWGYRSPLDGTLQPYRLFVPEPAAAPAPGPLPVVFLFAIGHEPVFWAGKGGSHAEMVRYTSLSSEHGVLAVLPHGRGAERHAGTAREEVGQILAQLRARFAVDTSRVALLTWSYKTVFTLDLLEAESIPVTTLGIVSPTLRPTGRTTSRAFLERIHRRHPNLRIVIRHGVNDEDNPGEELREWVALLRSVGFDVDYREEPYANHHNFVVSDPVDEFYGLLAGTSRGR